MARIENTSERQYDVRALPTKSASGDLVPGPLFQIPRSDDEGGTKKRVNGVGEIPDDILKELLARDVWTKAVFDSGDLIVATAPAAPAASDDAPAKGKK